MIVKTILDKRRANTQGLFPIKLRITEGKESLYIAMKIYTDPVDFDESSGLFITSGKKKNNNQLIRYNSLINSITNRANDIIFDYRRECRHLPITKLKALLKEGEQPETTSYNFSRYFKKYMDEKDGRTKKVYQTTLNKIEHYFGKEIEFEEVDRAWLELFNRKMKTERVYNQKGNLIKTGIETNSRSIHFRNIRAVFNHAINNDIIGIV